MSFELVNGFICHNCTDVDYAKRHIDPQHPKDGPFGINKDQTAARGPAVAFGGALAKSVQAQPADSANGVTVVNGAERTSALSAADPPTGGLLDVRV